MSRQLTFDLGAKAAFARADFFRAGSNDLAVRTVDDPAGWPQGKLLLIGPAGSGKTHLAHIWAEAAGAVLVSGADLAGHGPDLAGQSVAVDDADSVAGDPARETMLFHLHNSVLEGGGRVLLTARGPVRDWGLVLPDLASRVAAAHVARLDPPDDALLSAVLVKLFADRQIAVPPTLIAYLVTRMERSVAAAGHLVEQLDAAALASQRAVTRSLAAEILDSGGRE